jgi:formate dehydrogenase (coenzyme F420) beta subunit
MTNFKQIEENLKKEAARLLESGSVAVVLAYTKAIDEKHPQPFAAKNIADVEKIIFNEYCNHNLARYITRYAPGTKIAVAVKSADSRAVIVLIQEEKFKREDVVLLGIPATGMRNQKTDEIIDEKTTGGLINPVIYDILLGEEVHTGKSASPYDVLIQYEKMDKDARWEFWKVQFAKCIRCYACRKACPMCYCDPCFMDQSTPRWAVKSPQAHGNLMYHLTRFQHLAGRCIDCGECTRACPVDIPLYLFHKEVAKDCEEMFHQAAGMKLEDKPVMVDFRVEDSDKILE